MRRYRWHAAVLLLVIVLGGAFLVVGGPGGPAPGVPPGPPTGVPRVVVAMGDSTVSGEGAGAYEAGTDGQDGNWCHRSTAAFVHLLELPGVDGSWNLACSGAPSAQVGLGDAEQYTEGSQARRLGGIARANRVVAVVVAVGANDDPGFSHVLDACVQAWFSRDQPPCSTGVGAGWQDRVEAMVPKVVRALADVRAVLRDAGYGDSDYQLVLQSYAAPVGPDVLPGLQDLSGCPFRTEDLRWVRDTAVTTMTAGVRGAARESGARFLDLSRAGLGHEACALPDPAGEWFSRLAVQWSNLQDEDRATHALQESFHPNALGHAELARCLREFLAASTSAGSCTAGPDGRLHAGAVAGP